MEPIVSTNLKSLKKLFSGKVRDVYEIDDHRLLLVATDRLSAFDVVFQEGIPNKGKILTSLSNFWFAYLAKEIPTLQHHLLPTDPATIVAPHEIDQTQGRSVVVKRTKPLPIEAVVRGYLAGSGWKSYQESGAVCGINLPPHLAQSAKIPTPIFTPATKADVGEHDENISFESMSKKIGTHLSAQVRELSLKLYQKASEYALERQLIIADTKFEFGIGRDDADRETLMLIDEALTPDSSRYWDSFDYREGISPPSFDKQFLRDYLLNVGWNQRPPPPPLPESLIHGLMEKYQSALTRLQF